MAGPLSLSSTVEVFPCPSCHETINTSDRQCPHCSTPIDPVAAAAAGTATTRVSQACSDASYLNIMCWAAGSFFLIMFLPLLGFAGFFGLWFLRFALPFMSIRWWIKFGRIQTDDPDFSRAKNTATAASVLAGLLLLGIVGPHITIGGHQF
ncbi:MAG TPA: hypothetical protein VGN01_09995 [Acidobacteriaceae bacterium]|jgi:hypothetical protein